MLKGDEPNALIVHLDTSVAEGKQSVRPALAATLFKEGTLSLGGAVQLSGLVTRAFLQYLGELGIDVVRCDETTGHDTADLDRWLAS